MRGFSSFATTFHFRAQVIPKDKHEILSELLIMTLELWGKSLELIGAKLLIEDEKGKPRKLRAWAHALRTIIDEPGAPIRPSESLEEFELEELPRAVQFRVEIVAYATRDEAIARIIRSSFEMGEAALALVGAKVSFLHGDNIYTPKQFAEKFFHKPNLAAILPNKHIDSLPTLLI